MSPPRRGHSGVREGTQTSGEGTETTGEGTETSGEGTRRRPELTLAQQLLLLLLQSHQFSLQLGRDLGEKGGVGEGGGDRGVLWWGEGREGLTCASRRRLCSSMMSSSWRQKSSLPGDDVSCDIPPIM